jgi:hypothetical protein
LCWSISLAPIEHNIKADLADGVALAHPVRHFRKVGLAL